MENKPMSPPTDKNNQNTAIGCLLIHGFGGSISEVQPLADRLAEKGFKVECPSWLFYGWFNYITTCFK
ncbi:MAG: hypothetical protein K0R09_3928 [Clostridiales bacterium]|nr:hypothetical protein [Clostridiales bacterium]